MNNYPNKVYLNGTITDFENATISVFDRGFLFGDGVYEVMVQINGKRFYEEEHLERLSLCLKIIKIVFDVKTIPTIIDKLIKESDLKYDDCLIYIQVSRGVAPRKHHFPDKISPTVLVYALPYKLPEINTTPYKIVLMEDYRWHRCDIKTISLSASVLANDTAIKQGKNEAVFYRGKYITEGSHSNIFFVKSGTVYTHLADHHILDGITRKIVIQLCKKLDIPFKEKAILKDEIMLTDEAFLTGTTTQIASIKQIDKHLYYPGDRPGHITAKLQQAYLELKYNEQSVS